MARLRFFRLFWRAPRMTMASPGSCSCFTTPNFTGEARPSTRNGFLGRDQDVSHQRAAMRAVDEPGSVELELIGIAALAEVMRGRILRKRLIDRGALARLAVLGELD